MSMNREGRPTRPIPPRNGEGDQMKAGGGVTAAGATATWTGNRALMLEEPLLFAIGDT